MWASGRERILVLGCILACACFSKPWWLASQAPDVQRAVRLPQHGTCLYTKKASQEDTHQLAVQLAWCSAHLLRLRRLKQSHELAVALAALEVGGGVHVCVGWRG